MHDSSGFAVPEIRLSRAALNWPAGQGLFADTLG